MKKIFWVVMAFVLSATAAFAASANITFDQIPAGTKKPGTYVEQDTSLANRALPSMARKVLVIGQKLGARVEREIWQGGTLDDLTSGGTYTATGMKRYRVKISTTGTPDQMQYSDDNGATWSVASNVTTTMALSSGVTLTFGATTGHAASEEWRFNAWPAGTATAETAAQIFSDGGAATAYGMGSVAHLMARAAMQRNPYLDLSVVSLDDSGAGVASSATLTIANTATAAGALRFYAGDQYVDVAIASGNTNTTVARDLANAIATKGDLPVTAMNASNVLTLTAKNKGTVGNDIGLGYTLTAGIGTSITVSAMSSGATDPAIQDALDAVYSTRYHLLVSPYNNQTALGTLKIHVEEVSNAVEQRGTVGIYATTGTLSAATTLASQVNSIRIAGAYLRYTAGTTQKRTPSWMLASMTAAGIAADPDVSGPVKHLALAKAAAPTGADRLSRTEQEACLIGGVSPIEVGPGETSRLVRMPLTYTLDTNGQAVFVDVHKMFGLDYVRDAVIADISALAPSKIVREGTATTVNILRNIVLSTAYKCQQAGQLTGVTSYKDQYIVEEDLTNVGQMNIMMPSPVADGLYVTAVKQVLY